MELNRKLISSKGRRAVSGRKAQKKIALVTLQMTKSRKNLQPCDSIAGAVICPIIVLKAKDTITPMDTPLDRVRVSKTSEGITQDREPQVKENENWKSQPKAMKSHSMVFFRDEPAPSK